MKIRKDINVFVDGSAAIKTAGLIGDKFVKIEPGGSGERLKPGGWITETSSPVDIEDLIGISLIMHMPETHSPEPQENVIRHYFFPELGIEGGRRADN